MDKLFDYTGHDSIDDRNTEAYRLIDELKLFTDDMEPHESRFVYDMNDRKDRNELRCSAKQLFWLRDLYEKYCI